MRKVDMVASHARNRHGDAPVLEWFVEIDVTRLMVDEVHQSPKLEGKEKWC